MDKSSKQKSKGELQQIAKELRLDVLEMTRLAASGHPSSSFSAVEIVTALFFGGIMRYRPGDPWWPERDRFIMSKGHAAPLLYAALARAGYFERELLWTLRQVDSPVQGHPIQGMLPGVEATTGSLGQGLSLAIGHLLGARLSDSDFRVYVLMGDGECEAGQIWEAAMAAAHFKTERLVAILDYNKFQETGPISREMGLEPLVDKWAAFGWHVREVDGHDVEAVRDNLLEVQRLETGPTILIAHTTKGKGVSFVEADFTYHGRPILGDLAKQAQEEIQCS